MKSYEGMFLFDNSATHDWAAMLAEVNRLLERAHATVHVCVKFDERKLAYEIRGKKRGTYALCYFDAPTERMSDLERDALLSESLLRFLFLRIEPLSEAKLAELKAHPADQPLRPMASGDGRRGDDFHGGYGGYSDRRGGGGRRDAEPFEAPAEAGVDALAER
ncbi:MAG: 30S ribosomal protein S6 [Planctomycetes bacterium]|nr:30S ribosomal protein S6 [Planctomycetota bacterium]